MPSFKIANSSTAPTGWLVSYNPTTGLVNETCVMEVDATDYGSASARNAVIALINSNPNNTFIGHVPPPPKH
jgi:hypothetical protein